MQISNERNRIILAIFLAQTNLRNNGISSFVEVLGYKSKKDDGGNHKYNSKDFKEFSKHSFIGFSLKLQYLDFCRNNKQKR